MDSAALAILGFMALVFAPLGLFVVFRKAALWYWRVNEAVDLLTSIDARMARIESAQVAQAVKDRKLVGS